MSEESNRYRKAGVLALALVASGISSAETQRATDEDRVLAAALVNDSGLTDWQMGVPSQQTWDIVVKLLVVYEQMAARRQQREAEHVSTVR